MIVALDNNEEYSDHKIAFVEIPQSAVTQLRAALKQQDGSDSRWTIAFAAETVEWFSGKPMSLADFLEDLPSWHGGSCEFFELDPEIAKCSCWRKQLRRIAE